MPGQPMSRAERTLREQTAAKLVAGWFRTNVGALQTFTVEHVPGQGHVATATLVLPLTPEEAAQFHAIMEPPAAAVGP